MSVCMCTFELFTMGASDVDVDDDGINESSSLRTQVNKEKVTHT